jgi:hypothetical protein
MSYLTNYYKNRCENLQEEINNLQKLLNEDDKDNELDPTSKEGQAAAKKIAQRKDFEEHPLVKYTTANLVFKGMYGDKLPKILKDIEERKKTDPLKLQDRLNKTYNVPNYSQENLENLVTVKVGKLSDDNLGANAETDLKSKEVTLNIEDPSNFLGSMVSNIKKAKFPSFYSIPKTNLINIGNTFVHEVGGHVPQDAKDDDSFTLNPYTNYRSMPKTTREEQKKRQAAYVKSPHELSAHMTPIKYHYMTQTGKYLGANATDEEINTMKSYYKDYNKNNAERGKDEILMMGSIDPVLDALETEEGRELFRLSAQRNKNKDSSERIA